MVPKGEPEVVSVELRCEAAHLFQDRANRVRLWWSAMARSHAALSRPIRNPHTQAEIKAMPSGDSSEQRCH